MRYSHTLFIISFLVLTVEAPGQWERINPKPTNVPLNGIWFVDSLESWAVGSGGTVIHSTDGGNTWSEHLLLPRGELQRVWFTDRLHGVIVGGDISAMNGALFVTTDGGLTWVDKHPNPTYRYAYFDLQFMSSDRGWIAGFEGIFRTPDGGQTWLRSTSSGLGWNTSVFFLDSLHGWCTNPSGKIMQSTDGGMTWLPLASLGWRWFKRIRFATSQVGWAVGGGLYETKGIIVHTTDGGTTWTVQDTTVGYEYHDIQVIDSLQAWVVGDYGIVRYTTNGGGIWYTAPTNNTDTYQGISFRGSQLWIVGGSYFYPVILTSENGGNPRVTKSSHFTLAALTAMQFTSDTTAWLAADDGTLFKSTDGGVRWQPYNLFAVPWRSMSSPSSNTLFVGGDNGTFLRTTDAGKTWTLSTISGILSVSEMEFVNTDVGWIVGGDAFGGPLYKTTDAGTTWISLDRGGSRFQFLDEQNGWLIQPIITLAGPGEATFLFHTTDGGSMWSSQLFQTSIHDITFFSADKGWMTAGYDSVLQTTDSGTTWHLLTRLGDIPSEIKFVTENEGWVRGIQTIFHTTDAGLTFTPEYEAMTQIPDEMYFRSSRLGFVFGRNGGLLRYSKLTTGVGENPPVATLPDKFILYQNYPNPFNPFTTIRYALPTTSHVILKVFDVLGRGIVTLIDAVQEPGLKTLPFDGSALPSGVYLYQLRAGHYVESRKLLLLK